MNVELLEKVADYIQEHPEEFDMQTWHCGTTYCIGGTAVHLSSGIEIDDNDNYCWIDGEERSTFEAAQKVLGLTYDQAQTLFYMHTRYAYDENGDIVTKEFPVSAADAALAIKHLIHDPESFVKEYTHTIRIGRPDAI